MIGTINCVYETPCGWCSKWDKKCDKKITNTTINTDESIDGITVNKITCNHQWEGYGISTPGTQYICKKCGKIETRPINYNNYTIIN